MLIVKADYLIVWWLLHVGKISILLMVVCIHTAEAVSSKLPIIRISASELTPYAVGLEIGRQSKALFHDIEQRYDAHLQTVLSQTQFERIVRQQLPALLKKIDKSDQQALQAVRSVWLIAGENKLGDGRLSADEYYVLNLLPELGVPPGGVGIGVFDQASAESGPIVGRNLDWRHTPDLRAVQAITVYEYPEQRVVSLGFAGLLGVLTGFNEQGLFVAYINAAAHTPYQQLRQVDATSQLSGFELRNILRQHASVPSAWRAMSRVPFVVSHSVLLADRNTIKVLEYSVGQKAQLRTWDSATRSGYAWDRVWQLAVIDCHVLPNIGDPCQHLRDQVRWQRLRTLLNFHPTQPAHARAVADILLDTRHQAVALLNDQTVQSQLYVPATQHLYLSARSAQDQGVSSHQLYTDLIPNRLTSSINMMFIAIGILVCLACAGVVWFARQTQVFVELRKYFF